MRIFKQLTCQKMTAYQFLLWWKKERFLPMSTEDCKEASNSEIKRWLEKGAVLFNGKKYKTNEVLDFPIFSLVFFPKGKRKTTML